MCNILDPCQDASINIVQNIGVRLVESEMECGVLSLTPGPLTRARRKLVSLPPTEPLPPDIVKLVSAVAVQ